MKKVLILSILFLTIFKSAFSSEKECESIIFDIKEWKVAYTLRGNEYWGRHESWFNSNGTITETGSSFDFNPALEKSYNIVTNDSSPYILIYAGPWQKITLSYPSGLFETPKTVEKEIRLIAKQSKVRLSAHFEAKDDLNKNIEAKPLINTPYPVDIANSITLCQIQWADKYGYDAVVDYQLNPFRFFTGKIFNGSGKIINFKTREIIADEKGNLIK